MKENMMKLGRCAIALCAIAVFVVCKEAGKSDSPAVPRGQPAQPFDTIAHYDSLLTLLCARQDAVFDNPRDSSLAAALSATAFDTESGGFLAVGKATFSPELPAAAQAPARKRAAQYVGERWALYLKAWRLGRNILFGAPVSGTITYSKELYAKETGDTLYQLILVPVGSVELEEQAAPSAGSARMR